MVGGAPTALSEEEPGTEVAVLRTIRSCRTIHHSDGNAGGAVEAGAALARSQGKGVV
jgi:hypothetical protein